MVEDHNRISSEATSGIDERLGGWKGNGDYLFYVQLLLKPLAL